MSIAGLPLACAAFAMKPRMTGSRLLQEHYVSVAKREDKYEPPGIVTPPGLIKYKKHEASALHTTLRHPLPAQLVCFQESCAACAC